jgi:hypothetical protein
VWSLSNDNKDGYRQNTPNGPGDPLPSCLGGPYWNWAPLYDRMLGEIHRGIWNADDEVLEPWTASTDSIVGFQLNPNVGIDDSAVRSLTTVVIQSGPDRIYRGAYDVTGQRDANGDGVYDAVQSVAAGETLGKAEYDSMCWFAKGIVEKADPLDPTSADQDANVPDDHHPPPSDILGPPGAPAGVGVNCRENQ